MTARLRLPAPSPYSGPHRCGTCLGAGITGATFTMRQVNVGGVLDSDGTVLVVDEICDECQGCGRDPDHHDTCTPMQHAGWQPEDYDFEDYPVEPGSCASCGGRHWFPVQGFNERRATVLRVPCGCATDLLVEA